MLRCRAGLTRLACLVETVQRRSNPACDAVDGALGTIAVCGWGSNCGCLGQMELALRAESSQKNMHRRAGRPMYESFGRRPVKVQVNIPLSRSAFLRPAAAGPFCLYAQSPGVRPRQSRVDVVDIVPRRYGKVAAMARAGGLEGAQTRTPMRLPSAVFPRLLSYARRRCHPTGKRGAAHRGRKHYC